MVYHFLALALPSLFSSPPRLSFISHPHHTSISTGTDRFCPHFVLSIFYDIDINQFDFDPANIELNVRWEDVDVAALRGENMGVFRWEATGRLVDRRRANRTT